jgi:hypothetical protein
MQDFLPPPLSLSLSLPVRFVTIGLSEVTLILVPAVTSGSNYSCCCMCSSYWCSPDKGHTPGVVCSLMKASVGVTGIISLLNSSDVYRVKCIVFWCVMLCNLVDIPQSFLRMKSLSLQVQYRRPDPEDGGETWVSIYQTTRYHVLRRASSGYSPVCHSGALISIPCQSPWNSCGGRSRTGTIILAFSGHYHCINVPCLYFIRISDTVQS